MDWTLELQSSEVQLTDTADQQVCLCFSAALVRQGEADTFHAEEGHVKGVVLRFDQVTWTGDVPLCIGALSDSFVMVDGVLHRHLPVGWSASGTINAEFNFRSGTTLTVLAQAVHCQAPDDPLFVTSYAC
ncbi:MAG: hypothetical protein Q7V20_01515 [Aquabacterium sp.]|uniref:hypothetical protein n=1 Tax=Aquabacterium sp. TaxID=1872578 RepID=UPI002720AAEA|nr:hypothetical protein [Aquabacterium sp.]MDO9002111.1 hypothetical protein [Aquabacterium sp.]